MNDPKRFRFCHDSFHAERGALVVGILGCFIGALCLIHGLVNLNLYHVLSAGVGFLVHALLIIAQRRRNPWLYLPYIFFSAVFTTLLILTSLAFVVLAIVSPEFWVDLIRAKYTDEPRVDTPSAEVDVTGPRLFTICMAIFLTLYTFLHVWLLWIVYRAHEYMRVTNVGVMTLTQLERTQSKKMQPQRQTQQPQMREPQANEKI